MGTGQTLITLGALILLTVTVLNVNRSYSHFDTSLTQNKSRLEGLSILSSYIEQSSQYMFDEAVEDSSSAKSLSDFTEPGQLGFDSNDSSTIDDFDDYNGLTLADTGKSGVIYNVSFEVNYVYLSNSKMIKSNSKKYHKQMKISVYDNYNPPLLYKMKNGVKVRDTLKMSFVRSYWFYN